MENFKFTLFSILILGLLTAGGYWAFSTIETGSTHVDTQKQRELEQKNEELIKEITQLKKDIGLLELDKQIQTQKDNEAAGVQVAEPVASTTATVTTPTPPKTVVSKYQTLINELQKLVDRNVYLKNKSQGPAVGTIQNFFNIYNNTSSRIDNDYGLSTFNAVKSFQKAEGLTVDGEAGPGVFKKMISWLKSH